MLTSARIPEPRDPTERPAPAYRRWVAQFRSQSRSVQALIAYTAVAVAVCAIATGVYLAGHPGQQPIEVGASAQAAPRMVEPPSQAVAKPTPVNNTGPKAADAAETETAGATTPPIGQAVIPAEELAQQETPTAAAAEPEYGIGGGTFGVPGERFEGDREYIPASPSEAWAAIRAHTGTSPLEQLPMSFTYHVQPGETMAGIAQRFGLHISSVRVNNMHIDDPVQMQVGTELELPTRDGLLYKVQRGDALDALIDRYEADRDATIAYELNRLTPDPNAIYIEQRLLLVGGTRPDLNGAYFAPLRSPEVWYMPVEYERITDPFGTPRNNHYGIHTGVDFAAPSGAPVRAARAGTVTNGGWENSYGYWIEIDHGGEIKSRYAHLSDYRVSVGQRVAAGEVIGWIGSTGQSTGPHLHFEILRDNQPINPHPALGLS